MWKIDTTRKGLDAVFKKYQYLIIILLVEDKTGINSKQFHDHVNKGRKNRIASRAAVIQYLNKLSYNGIVTYHEESCKGGFRRIYKTDLSLEQIITKIVNEVLQSMANAFPSSDYLKFLTSEG